MWRTRLFLGLLSAAQGIGGLLFTDGSITRVVAHDSWGAWWCVALVGCGALMAVSSVAEALGYSERWCREFSASMLGSMWLALFFEALQDSAYTIATLAPIYFAFCVWAFWAEAEVARRSALAKKREVRDATLG